MGLFDKLKDRAKGLAGQHSDKIDTGLEKAGAVADEKTGDTYSEQIDQGVEKAQEAAHKAADEDPA